ncbi:MAG: ABC transporter permease [Clostridia bacterium]|nr:ABC transporter permease [Clostridia bacterium]
MNKKRSFLRTAAAYPHMVWSVLFIVVPLLFVLYYALTVENPDGSFSFSFANITALGSESYFPVFIRSICFAVVATVICLLLAYPLAYALTQCKVSSQRMLIMLVMLPMWMNLLIRTYSWMNILETNGVINNFLASIGLPRVQLLGNAAAVILGMVYNFLPYMVLPIYTVMSKIDRRYIEAAADLGCNGWQTMLRVILPLSASGVISGITMVFVPSVSTFYISQKMGNGRFEMIGDTIERQFMSNYDYHMGATLSLVLMVLIIICLAVMNRFGEEDGGVLV